MVKINSLKLVLLLYDYKSVALATAWPLVGVAGGLGLWGWTIFVEPNPLPSPQVARFFRPPPASRRSSKFRGGWPLIHLSTIMADAELSEICCKLLSENLF